jgi:hypothetical protein
VEHHKLLDELFSSLNNIQETYNVFEKLSVILEQQIKKRQQASKAIDDIVDWKRHIKDKLEDIPVLDSFKFKRIRTSLDAWQNVCEIVEETIKKAHEICGRR